MKLRFMAIAVFSLSLTITALGQQARLEGNVYEIVNSKEIPVDGVRVVSPDGQSKDTDSKGHFVIDFPNSVRPGRATRIEVARPRWVVRDPLFGECTTQDPARNFELLKVVIVPKGSPLALEPKQLSKVIARWADERAKLRGQVNELGRQLDESAFLREYAARYGITLDQFKAAADEWAKMKESEDKEERALKEYWRKNYDSAAQLARESAIDAVEELERANKERLEAGRKVIRRFRLEGNSFYQQYKCREAMAAYNEIEKLFSARKIAKEDLPEEWADTQNNLGIALWCQGERGSGRESAQLLAEAVAAFREALKARTREQSPQTWAGTQDNLALALRSQGERSNEPESVRLLAESVAMSRESLKVYTREQNPEDWAKAQNNLGGTLTKLAGMLNGEESVRILAEAVAAFHEALKVRTREQSPQAWAMTQNNLGLALQEQGKQASGEESARLLAESITAFREALKVYTREQFPQAWAWTQNNLGLALHAQGKQASGEESARLLAESIAAYSEALKVYTREQLPQDWAMAQNNLGYALMLRGERAEGAEGVRFLAESITAFREALKVYTREQLPQQWAMTQNNLGNALIQQGERVGGRESVRLLTESVTVFREALKAIREPQGGRLTQNHLGGALRALGKRVDGEEGVRLLAEAATAYREALKIFTTNHEPMVWAATQINLGRTLVDQARRSSKAESARLLTQSIIAYREALKVFTQAQIPQFWAMIQGNLGEALYLQGERTIGEEGRRLLTESVTSYREALKVYTREQNPDDWAITHSGLAYSFYLLKDWQNAAASYTNALELDPQYEEGYRRLADIYHERLFEYVKAFELHAKWLALFPEDVSAQADFAETHLTTGRFSEFPQRVKALLANPNVSSGIKAALRMIETANLLALGRAERTPAALDDLCKYIADQRGDFRIEWTFRGTLHFINERAELAAYRPWLNQFFAAAEEENRDAILKRLRKAQAQFPAVNNNQRK